MFVVSYITLHEGSLDMTFSDALTPYDAAVDFIKPDNEDSFRKSYPTLEAIQDDYCPNSDSWLRVADPMTREVF